MQQLLHFRIKNFIILIGSLLTLVSTNSYADFSYQLIAFENSSYRDFSLLELKYSLKQDAQLLTHYQCDQQSLKDVFYKPPRNNPLKNSLRVRLLNSTKTLIYQKGKFFDEQGKRHKLDLKKDDFFISHAAHNLKKIEKTKNGATLLRLLEESYYPITITLGGNSFSSHIPEKKFGGIYMSQAIMIISRLRKADDSLPFRAIGNGGDVNWHPTLAVFSLEQDGVKRVTPAEITLSHELFHAYDSIRGLLDFRFIRSSQSKGDEVILEDENPLLSSTNVSEYRAVYFENLIRKELKYKYRKAYSQSEIEEVPMLNEKNQPVLIPAPCLQLKSSL
jgi:hypothetical protein